uniref:Ig-like domain-containing protein n=1 Tax=Pygocentrus nattereri TaxID=42514 RepID=A0A3B4E2M2_PYGNA
AVGVEMRTFSRSSGESVLLPCPCPPDQHRINPDRVTWTKDQTAVSNDTESYRGRVWMFNQNHSRNFSLLISDLTKEDSGLYTCRADEKDMPYVQLDLLSVRLKRTVTVAGAVECDAGADVTAVIKHAHCSHRASHLIRGARSPL